VACVETVEPDNRPRQPNCSVPPTKHLLRSCSRHSGTTILQCHFHRGPTEWRLSQRLLLNTLRDFSLEPFDVQWPPSSLKHPTMLRISGRAVAYACETQHSLKVCGKPRTAPRPSKWLKECARPILLDCHARQEAAQETHCFSGVANPFPKIILFHCHADGLKQNSLRSTASIFLFEEVGRHHQNGRKRHITTLLSAKKGTQAECHPTNPAVERASHPFARPSGK